MQKSIKILPKVFVVATVLCLGVSSEANEDGSSADNWLSKLESTSFCSVLKGKDLFFRIPKTTIKNMPSWRLGSKLPVSMLDAMTVANKELVRLVGKKSKWVVMAISLERVGVEEGTLNKWVYIIEYRQKGRLSSSNLGEADYLRIPVLLTGAVVTGQPEE